MTEPPDIESPTNGSNGEHDSLTRIRGIGPAKQQWFEALGIGTINELASASADELEFRFREAEHIVSRHEIEEWIAQAQELATELSQQQALAPSEADIDVLTSPAGEIPQPTTESSATAANLNAEADIDVLTAPLAAAGETLQPTSETSTTGAGLDIEVEGLAASLPPEVSGLSQSSEVAPEAVAETFAPLADSSEWHTFASFRAEFQARQIEDCVEQRTTIRHQETDTIQSWPGVEAEELQQWMLHRVDQASPSEPITEQPPVAARITTQLNQLCLLQPPETGLPLCVKQASQMLPAMSSNEPFALEVAFDLLGEAIADITRQPVTYQIQWDAKGLNPPYELIHLGGIEPQRLVADQTSYTTRLPEATLHSGIYRLQVLLTLQGVLTSPVFFDALVIQVV
ncbi:MAG: hypothetical protein F6K19_38795 [Cyanothece sp. SIO1E1]|nr:hypothetical protein [Cyanothece sp. SIO1E1]